MSPLIQAGVTDRGEIRPGLHYIELLTPELAQLAAPGQFLHIRCGDGHDPLLRRPISIHAVNRRRGLVKILFQVLGRGTRWLAEGKASHLDILGPLGRGFTLPKGRLSHGVMGEVQEQFAVSAHGTASQNPDHADFFTVLGGGMGAAPLFFLLQELKDRVDPHRVQVLLGAARRDLLLLVEQIKKLGFPVHLATDDGSAGHRGNVVDLLSALMRQPGGGKGFVYACGPWPMLKALCAKMAATRLAGEVSVEEKMACGVGACLSCVCQTRHEGGLKTYSRVCLDGPVFPAGEVVFDD